MSEPIHRDVTLVLDYEDRALLAWEMLHMSFLIHEEITPADVAIAADCFGAYGDTAYLARDLIKRLDGFPFWHPNK